MNVIELYAQTERFSVDEFYKAFTAFGTSAFRLELLATYIVEEEKEPIALHRSGTESPPPGFNEGWAAMLTAAKRAGKRFDRVRLINEPLSDYLRFEIAWGYRVSVPAGENVRMLDQQALDQLQNMVPILKDFWLFDNKECIFVEYDVIGRFIGASKLPIEIVPSYVEMKAKLLELSKDIRATKYWNPKWSP